MDELTLSQSTVSQHLKELKAAGLVKGDIEGVKVYYCIDELEWEMARTYISSFMTSFSNKNKCRYWKM